MRRRDTTPPSTYTSGVCTFAASAECRWENDYYYNRVLLFWRLFDSPNTRQQHLSNCICHPTPHRWPFAHKMMKYCVIRWLTHCVNVYYACLPVGITIDNICLGGIRINRNEIYLFSLFLPSECFDRTSDCQHLYVSVSVLPRIDSGLDGWVIMDFHCRDDRVSDWRRLCRKTHSGIKIALHNARAFFATKFI